MQFYTELVSDIERDCHKIFTVDDIMNYPVYSVKRALKILEIFDEIFDDISILPLLRDFIKYKPTKITSNVHVSNTFTNISLNCCKPHQN